MIDHIVLDVEIQKTIEELPNGWDDTQSMGVSCAVVYEYSTDRFRVYGPVDLIELKDRIEVADRISGYNILNFDFPVIYGVDRKIWMQKVLRKSLTVTTNDLLRRIWKSAGLNPDDFTLSHKPWTLDNVCKGTLGKGKIGFGGDAPKWYQEGLLWKVINYCIDDVALEKELTDFIDKYHYVVNEETGQYLKIM